MHLPLSWDDPGRPGDAQIERYMSRCVRDAPWCPSNIEFIRRINGLDRSRTSRASSSTRAISCIGLGDVYLGAPVATPLDPRHRLVTTKYNPARTWTPENAVGIGGAYLCIYGMEGPGGYQLVGRTMQVWNSWRAAPTPSRRQAVAAALLRPDPLLPGERRRTARGAGDIAAGRLDPLKIEPATFNMARVQALLDGNAGAIAVFQTRQARGLSRPSGGAWERRWRVRTVADEPAVAAPRRSLPAGGLVVDAPMPSSVWKVGGPGWRRCRAGQTLMVLEAMKMRDRRCRPGRRPWSSRCWSGRADRSTPGARWCVARTAP